MDQLTRDAISQCWGRNWSSVPTQSPGSTQWPPGGFHRIVFLQVSEDTCTPTGVGICPGVYFLRLQMNTKVYFDSFPHIRSPLMRAWWEHSRKIDSSQIAVHHEADGRRGDIGLQRISRPCEAHKSSSIGVSILGQLFIWEITLVLDHIL